MKKNDRYKLVFVNNFVSVRLISSHNYEWCTAKNLYTTTSYDISLILEIEKVIIN